MELQYSLEAIEDFSQALKLNPNSIDALLGRGMAYNHQQNWQAAAEDLSKAVGIAPADELAWLTLALSYIHLGYKAKALTTLDSPNWSSGYKEQVENLRYVAGLMDEMDLEELALNAFLNARNDEEMREAFKANTILYFPEFQQQLRTYIENRSDEILKKELEVKLEILLSIVNNPAQLALDAFMNARNTEEMAHAISNNEFLRDPKFLIEIRRMQEKQGNSDLSNQIESQFQLLKMVSN